MTFHASSPTTDYTVLSGRAVLRDPGMAQLRRYLPVLAVIAAPYAGLGGEHDPLNPLDHSSEWRLLRSMFDQVADRQTDASTPLALVRMMPPTADQLGQVLAASGRDAFQVAHIVAYGERDMLYLEDDNGHEAYAVAEHTVRLFKNSRIQVVVLDGGFSRRLADMLLEATSAQVVVGTRRRVAPENMLAFAVPFYTGISGGIDVREAFRAALMALGRRAEGQADRFEIVTRSDLHEVVLNLPAPGYRAPRPLLAAGMPRVIGGPEPVGFIGQRELLSALSEDIPFSGPGWYAIHGPVGTGKSWLASEFVARFAWRFPAGVCWLRVNAQTTAREVLAAAAPLLGLPVHAPEADIVAGLVAQRALLVLDGVEELALDELRALAEALAAIDPATGSWVLVTASDLTGVREVVHDCRAVRLDRFTYKAARTLAMKLAVERNLEVLDVDTIDDFLDRSLQIPALITRGLDVLEADGIAAALEWLAPFEAMEGDPVNALCMERLNKLESDSKRLEPSADPMTVLIRAQGLPDAFDERLAHALAGPEGGVHVERLEHNRLLWRDGRLLRVPPEVRTAVRERHALTFKQQTQLDRFLLGYLIKLRPASEPDKPLADAARAWLNNVRALMQRQTAEGSIITPALLAELLVAACSAFRAAGLASELMQYAKQVREDMREGPELGPLQVAMGDAVADTGHADEAGWLYRVTLSLENLDTATLAAASRAYGRHLVVVDQADDAVRVLAAALHALVTRRQPDDVQHYAPLAHDWANALAADDRYSDAVKRYQAAMSGYAEIQRADLSAQAQVDLSAVLLLMEEDEQAEDGLRRAMVTADQLKLRSLAGTIRERLAVQTMRHAPPKGDSRRAVLLDAEQFVCDALADVLPDNNLVALARLYRLLAEVQGQLARPDEAAGNMRRSSTLYEQAGCAPEQAETLALLGQLLIAQGNAAEAQATLHHALELAAAQADAAVLARAAGVLVRVHQLRARRAVASDDANFRQDSRAQAGYSQAVLVELGLDEHAAALSAVMDALA